MKNIMKTILITILTVALLAGCSGKKQKPANVPPENAEIKVEDAKKYIEDYFLQNFDVCDVKLNNIVEITTSRFHQLGEKGDNNGFIRRYRGEESDLKIDYHDNCQYEIGEELISEEQLIYEEAIKCAKEIMADDSLYEELERIYSVENEKKYYYEIVYD